MFGLSVRAGYIGRIFSRANCTRLLLLGGGSKSVTDLPVV